MNTCEAMRDWSILQTPAGDATPSGVMTDDDNGQRPA